MQEHFEVEAEQNTTEPPQSKQVGTDMNNVCTDMNLLESTIDSDLG